MPLLLISRAQFSSPPHGCRIRDVLRPRSRQLVHNEIFSRDEKRSQFRGLIDDAFNAPIPGVIKCDAGDFRKYFDHLRRSTHPKKRAAVHQLFRPQIRQRSPELRQRSKYRLRISAIRLDKEIEVFRRSRLCLNCQRVTPNNQIFNVVLVEGGQKFFEVQAEHRSGAPPGLPSIDTASPKAPTPLPAARVPARPATRGTHRLHGRETWVLSNLFIHGCILRPPPTPSGHAFLAILPFFIDNQRLRPPGAVSPSPRPASYIAARWETRKNGQARKIH